MCRCPPGSSWEGEASLFDKFKRPALPVRSGSLGATFAELQRLIVFSIFICSRTRPLKAPDMKWLMRDHSRWWGSTADFHSGGCIQWGLWRWLFRCWKDTFLMALRHMVFTVCVEISEQKRLCESRSQKAYFEAWIIQESCWREANWYSGGSVACFHSQLVRYRRSTSHHSAPVFLLPGLDRSVPSVKQRSDKLHKDC